MTGLEPPPPPRVCARVGWCRGKDTGFEVCSAGFICQACSIQAIWKVSGSSFETRGKEDLVYMAFANEIRGWIKNIGIRSSHMVDTQMMASVNSVLVGLTGNESMTGFSLSSDYAISLSLGDLWSTATYLPLFSIFKRNCGQFPSGLVVRTRCFHCHGPGFNPQLGNLDPASHKVQPKKRGGGIVRKHYW